MAENSMHHTHISAKHRWMDLNLKEVWQYRDLIYLFTKRNFVVSYKQTILGPCVDIPDAPVYQHRPGLCLRRYCRHRHRRDSHVPVLPVQQRRLERISPPAWYQQRQYLYRQRLRVRQGVFSPPDHAHLQRHLHGHPLSAFRWRWCCCSWCTISFRAWCIPTGCGG